MRVPNLNVAQSITQQLRALDTQRLKLNDQISTGQKITRPQDDGLTMGRVIQLDSQKSKLAQYQRNASYASEYLNAGHMNLDKLREINQRAQEIARLAGANLSGPGVSAYALEIDQLIEEALNRINARHRGRALFGGNELKPDFSVSDIITEEKQKSLLDFDSNVVGVEKAMGKRYLKQGDQLFITANGREYVVEAKTLDASEYNSSNSFLKGEVVKVTSQVDDSILLDPSLVPTDDSTSSLFETVISFLGQRDWSQSPVGNLMSDPTSDVYLLDRDQIEALSVSLGNQPFLDSLPSSGGYYAISEQTDGSVFLEPVINEIASWTPSRGYSAGDYVRWGDDVYQASANIAMGSDFSDTLWEKVNPDTVSTLFSLTDSEEVSYWEAIETVSSNSGPPSVTNHSWKSVNINEKISNLSTEKATALIRDLVNSDTFFLNDSTTFESDDYFAFTRSSNKPNDFYDPDLDLSAKINSSGQLEISGTVGYDFELSANYISGYNSQNYYPNQLDQIIREKSSYMFPGVSYDDLDGVAKESVWASVQSSMISWDLSVKEVQGVADTTINTELPMPWRRLQVYQVGDVVEFQGKLWESKGNENFNHSPSQKESDYWDEIGTGYDQIREDWDLTSKSTEVRYYFAGPDGRLFDDRTSAETHTYELLLGSNRSYATVNEIWNDIDKLVKEVAYPVSNFEALGSESDAQVFFDSRSQSYRLGVLDPEDSPVLGEFIMGEVKPSSDSEIQRGDVVQYRGTYFLAFHVQGLEDEPGLIQDMAEDVNAISGSLSTNVDVGEKIYDQNAGKIYMFLGDQLPVDGKEQILDSTQDQPLRRGSYIYDRSSKSFLVASDDINNASDIDLSDPDSPLVSVNSYVYQQGSEWSAGQTYFKGQVVMHKGVYYECQTNGVLDPEGNVVGFDNSDDDEIADGAGYLKPTVTPTDEFFLDVEDARSQDYMDLLKARGEEMANNVWLPVTKPLQHVFSFELENRDTPDVRIQSAGVSGVDAEIGVMTDINGNITSLRVDNPGRYFFPNNMGNALAMNIPQEFEEAEVFLPNGDSVKAKIIWGHNPNDPGPFVVKGFELLNSGSIDRPMGASKGDRFSFATGKKTFLDHRDNDGNLLAVTYTGSNENAEFYIGKDSKVSSYLDAQDNGTAELADSIQALIDLRDGLSEEELSQMSTLVQSSEQQLITQENSVIDKLGEISSVMTRMETVKAHDEQYHLELDRRLAQDLDIDMSDAIMRLTRASTAYQAAMQVGAQLLNTSLLNYL